MNTIIFVQKGILSFQNIGAITGLIYTETPMNHLGRFFDQMNPNEFFVPQLSRCFFLDQLHLGLLLHY